MTRTPTGGARSPDPLMDDALALVRAQAVRQGGGDLDGFAAMLNTTDCAEHHRLIIRLAALVELAATTPSVTDLDDLGALVDAMQGRSR